MGDAMAVPMFSLGKYIDFLFAFLVPFGIMFELPVVSVLLTSLGLIRAEWLIKARKVMIVVIFLLAAIIRTCAEKESKCRNRADK